MLQMILENREQRFSLRENIANRQMTSVSLNFNIPGYPKNSEKIQQAFLFAIKDLRRFLMANRITLIPQEEYVLNSQDCGSFFIHAIRYTYTNQEAKQILETFEITHPLGRLLDVDLFTPEAQHISSGKRKKCLLCNQTAYECAQQQNHTLKDYQTFIQQQVEDYLLQKQKKHIIQHITEYAGRALLYEVAVENKPGLICPNSNGSHSDMDFFTFLNSSASLSAYWYDIAMLGYRFANHDKELLHAITPLRMLGLEAEANMLKATNQVNTHKGSVFLLGYACFSASYTMFKQGFFDQDMFRATIQTLAKDLLKNDFEERHFYNQTHGADCYKKYGKTIAGGARYEVELGFPMVFDYALPYLQSLLHNVDEKALTNQQWQEILMQLLLFIMSKNNDTNILYRKDDKVLQAVKQQSEKALQLMEQGDKEGLKTLFDYCKQQQVSPGGSADILALTLFVHLCMSDK